MEYTAVYLKVPEGGYAAWVEELAGANTCGETLDEAREMLADAVQLLLATREELGLPSEPPDREPLPPDAEVIREPLFVPA